jgi:hypothetical protein
MNGRTPSALGLATCTLLLAACQTGYMKPGATEADFKQDYYACEQDAARMYPPIMVPGGYPPGFDTDTNMEKRNVAFSSCMKGKRWMFNDEVHYWYR